MHRATGLSTSFRAYVSGGSRSAVHEVDDAFKMQLGKANGMKNETRERIESPQNYGFTSVISDATKGIGGSLKNSAEQVLNFMGGNRSFPFGTSMDDRRHRLWNLAKDAAKGATAMFGQKEWGQQFLNTEKGMYMTGNTEKLLKFALVENKNGQKQQAQSSGGGSSGGAARMEIVNPPGSYRNAHGRLCVRSEHSGVEFEVEEFDVEELRALGIETREAGGGGNGGGSGGGTTSSGQNTATGQKTLHKEDSKIYSQFDKDQIFHKHNDGYAKITDKASQTYFKDEDKSTRADDSHVHIHFEGNNIWVDKGGCWSSKPIQIKGCTDQGGGQTGTQTGGPAAHSASDPLSIDNTGNMSMAVQNPLAIMGGLEYARDVDPSWDRAPRTVQPLGLLFKAPLYVDVDGYLTSTGGGTGGISEAPNDAFYYARHALSWVALGTMANQNATAVAITGGTINGVVFDGGSF